VEHSDTTVPLKLRSIHTIQNVSVSTRTVFDTPCLLTIHTVRRVFDVPSRFKLFRTYQVRLGMALNTFNIMKLGSVALPLYDDEQFQHERVSTERKM
jgi:hypothetical protein